jgi:LysR family transcriptional regulator, transcription activator of glutamate synthase operon
MSQTAQGLGMTQPALSRAVDRLEVEVGVPLFERFGRAIRLTAYGAAFLTRVESALNELEAGRRELTDMAGSERGTIALGFLRTLGPRYVPELVRAFGRIFPAVHFRFVQSNGAGLERQLVEGNINLALMTQTLAGKRLTWKRTLTQPLLLLVPPNHRLATEKCTRLADLADETFIAFPRGHAVRDMTDELCRTIGYAPDVAYEGDESSSIRGFVSAGFGVALVPDTGVADPLPALQIIDPPAEREIGLALVPGRYLSLAEREFVDFLSDESMRNLLTLEH